ncbi:MAG: glycosyltransferase [Deltaproteobacteria bacterium]|nr:glycosyltransferase [Deltaproteobacteria bacterium]
MTEILHITPHLGGGVGRVLLNYLSHVRRSNGEENHSIFCLDYANAAAVERAKQEGIPLRDNMSLRTGDLLNAVAGSDIVLIHWWNHPLLYALLVNGPFPPSRMLIWSHVSGHFPTQNFTEKLLSYPDRFVVSTPYSLEAPAVRQLSPEERAERIRLVFTCAGIEHVASAEPRPHEGFRVGYIGTVDYCKLHPHFISMSAAADIPQARFIVCGGPNETAIRKEAAEAGFGDRFQFTGQISDVAAMLSTFDVFGYPLAPYHYGTGEQAIIEALAAGVPPVVLANGAERHLVRDGVTGMVAHDAREYAQALETLFREPGLRLQLGANARRMARATHTIESLARSWSNVYREALQMPKRARSWRGTDADPATAAELFLASLGEYGADYAASMAVEPSAPALEADGLIANGSELFRARTRGSVFHYQGFFRDDPWLNLWCGLLELQEEGGGEARRHFTEAGTKIGNARVAAYLERLHGIA